MKISIRLKETLHYIELGVPQKKLYIIALYTNLCYVASETNMQYTAGLLRRIYYYELVNCIVEVSANCRRLSSRDSASRKRSSLSF